MSDNNYYLHRPGFNPSSRATYTIFHPSTNNFYTTMSVGRALLLNPVVPDKTQEQIIQQSWRSEEPSKLSAYKADTYNSFKLDKGFENLLAVPSLDSIVDPLLKHRYGKKASFKNGHSLYGTTYKSIEKEAYKGQCESRMAMIITMYIQQGLGKLLKVLQEKDVNIDMAVQSTKDIFAMASQNLDQCSRAGAYHHLVRRKATIADTGLDRRISDFERWELPLTHEGIFGKELENKMKLRKEENKSVQDLFSDDEKPNANKGFQNKRKSNFEQSSNSNYKRTRFESPKRRYNDKSDSGFRGRSQYRGGYSSRGQSSSRQSSSFRGGRRGNKQWLGKCFENEAGDTCRRSFNSFCRKMEIDHNRPVANRSSSRRLQTRIQQNSKISGSKGNTCYIHKFGINFSRSKRTFGKRMYRTCTCKSNYGRFLQHIFPGKKENRGHASCYQFTTSKQVSPKTTLQNGYPQNRVKFDTIRRLGSDTGPQRRLSSHTNFQKSQKVSEILHSRQVLPVSIPSIWSYGSPTNIYKSRDSSGCLLETTNYSSNSISGRLVDSKLVNKQRFKRSRLCNKSPVVFGVHSQCQEIESLSSPTFCVSRGSVCTRSRDSFSNSRQSNSTECSNSNNSTQNMYSPRLPTSIRSNGFMHSDCTERSLIHETNTKTSPESLETSISRMGSNNSLYTTAESSFGMVVKFSQHFERPIVCISNELCSPHDRCIDVCMGRSYWESSGSRSVVLRRKELAHKLSRAGGCHSVSETLSTQTERSVCVDTVRQHHSGAIHQQTKGEPSPQFFVRKHRNFGRFLSKTKYKPKVLIL